MSDSRSSDDAARFLRIYLEDHLAGAAAGTRRARRLADAERASEDGAALRRIADQIDNEHISLQAIVDHLGLHPQPYKAVLARVGEVVGLLKFNGRVLSRSPLTTLVEVEAMLSAVRGKLSGWQTLRTVFGEQTIGPIDLDDLIEQSNVQLATLSGIHDRAAIRALSQAPAD